jgi:hypothetical protein
MINLTPDFLFPIFLYAETHYKFKGIYSRLFKKEPEIIADAPFRLEPGQPIPVLLLVKDAHLFPIQLKSVLILLTSNNGENYSQTFTFNETISDQKYWHKILYFSPPENVSGTVQLDVHIKIKINDKTRIYRNDNYRISSHLPLEIFLANEPLPRLNNCYFGDFHYHSSFTEDHVEFGAPLDATAQMAQAMGLNFFAVTDHSYDLDDREDSFILNDPDIPKWFKMQQQVKQLNSNLKNFVILPGEEVSAGNANNRNIHLLIINNKHFFPGKGDGAEQWLRTKPDLFISEILAQLDKNALVIAGHPEMKIPFLQWLLIRRGKWQWQDYLLSRLEGFQIWNGEYNETIGNGTSKWVQLLLAGKKLSLIAGNDAHGNFNRFRQIGFPFFTFRETSSQIFGNHRTGVFLNKKFNQTNLIQEIKNKHVLVTNGPIANFQIQNEHGDSAKIGDSIQGQPLRIKLSAKSTSEFGKLKFLKLFSGDLDKKTEIELLTFNEFRNPYFFKRNWKLFGLPINGYLRLEVHAEKPDGKFTKCLTNPIWIKR